MIVGMLGSVSLIVVFTSGLQSMSLTNHLSIAVLYSIVLQNGRQQFVTESCQSAAMGKISNRVRYLTVYSWLITARLVLLCSFTMLKSRCCHQKGRAHPKLEVFYGDTLTLQGFLRG